MHKRACMHTCTHTQVRCVYSSLKYVFSKPWFFFNFYTMIFSEHWIAIKKGVRRAHFQLFIETLLHRNVATCLSSTVFLIKKRTSYCSTESAGWGESFEQNGLENWLPSLSGLQCEDLTESKRWKKVNVTSISQMPSFCLSVRGWVRTGDVRCPLGGEEVPWSSRLTAAASSPSAFGLLMDFQFSCAQLGDFMNDIT